MSAYFFRQIFRSHHKRYLETREESLPSFLADSAEAHPDAPPPIPRAQRTFPVFAE